MTAPDQDQRRRLAERPGQRQHGAGEDARARRRAARGCGSPPTGWRPTPKPASRRLSGTARMASAEVMITIGSTRMARVMPGRHDACRAAGDAAERLHEDGEAEDAVDHRRHAGQVADVDVDEPGEPALGGRTPRGRSRRRSRAGRRARRRRRRSRTCPAGPGRRRRRSACDAQRAGEEVAQPVGQHVRAAGRPRRPDEDDRARASDQPSASCSSRRWKTAPATSTLARRSRRARTASAGWSTGAWRAAIGPQYFCRTRRTKRSATRLRTRVMRNSRSPTKNRLWKVRPAPAHLVGARPAWRPWPRSWSGPGRTGRW